MIDECDSRRLLAYGELRGQLSAFAWANGKCDHNYTFEVEELPQASDIQAALVQHFGDQVKKVSIAELGDWNRVVRESLHRWLFSFEDLIKPRSLCMMTDG